MGIIGTIFIGFLVGLVARALMPGRDPAGFLMTTLLGIIGAFVARYLGVALHWYGPDEPAGFLTSVIGAMVVLFVYNKVRGDSATLAR